MSVDGQTIAIDNNGADVFLSKMGGELQIDGLRDNAIITRMDDVNVATAKESGTFEFADGQIIIIGKTATELNSHWTARDTSLT